MVKKIIEGFSNDMRREIWSCFILAKSQLVREKYMSFINEEVNLKISTDIELDAKHTFSSIPKFTETHSTDLSNLLKTCSLYDPEVGYCRGMSYVAAILLLYIQNEATAFSILVSFMHKFNWHILYIKDMPKLIQLINTL